MLAVDLNSPSWQCVHFTELGAAREALGSMSPGSVGVFELDASTITNAQELFAAVAMAFQFPSYFGKSWDALEDCLRDLEWLDERGYVVLVTRAEPFWRHNPQLAGQLVSSCMFVAEHWSERGRPFHLVFAW
jgi:hypothetical protein